MLSPTAKWFSARKLAPRIVEQRPVRLEVVEAAPPCWQVPALELHDPAIEPDPRQGRLAAVPNEVHHRSGAGGDERGDIRLEHLRAHPEVLAGGNSPVFPR